MIKGFALEATLHAPQRPLRLFIVEKNPAVRRVLDLLLSMRGWKVHTFGSAAECLRDALRQRPDCILSDLYPPDMDAVEFRRNLLWNGIGSPMVILSAYPDSSLSAAMRALGIDEVLDKPCDARMVEAAIARASSAVSA